MNLLNLTKQQARVLKGIALLFMIWHHLFGFPYRLSEEVSYFQTGDVFVYGWEYFIGVFGKFCVPLFIFLSGYGLWLVSGSLSHQALHQTLFQRGKRLVLMYWMAFLVVVAAATWGVNIPFDLPLFIKNLVGVQMVYDGNWWFLRVYLFLLICYPWIRKIIASESQTAIKWGLFFAGVYQTFYSINRELDVILLEPYVSGFEIEGAIFGIPMMIVGGLAAKDGWWEKGRQFFNNRKYATTLKGCLLLMVILIRSHLIISFVGKGIFVLDLILAPLFCFFVSELVGETSRLSKGLQFLGRYSTWGWLLHGFFLYPQLQPLTYALKIPVLIYGFVLGLTISCSISIAKVSEWLSQWVQRCRVKGIRDEDRRNMV